MTHNHFLNHQCGLDARENFLIIALPPYANTRSNNANQSAYTMVYKIHCEVLCGNTTERSSAYVGEQLAKIGPSDAHNNISHRTPFVSFALVASELAL